MTTTTRPMMLARLLIAGAGIMSLANSVAIPFLAIFLHRELGLTPTTIGFIIGSSVFFSIFAGFVGGSLSDALGRTRLLLLALSGVIASFVAFYFSNGVLAVFFINAALALSSSTFNPVAKALLSDLLPAEDRLRWFSYQYMAVNVGFAVGPLLGAYAGLSGGRVAFLVGAAVYAVYLCLFGLTLLFLPPMTPAVLEQEPSTGFRTHLEGLRDSFRVVVRDFRLLCFIAAGLLLEAVHSKISALLAQHLSAGFADGTKILGYVLTTNAVTVVVVQLFVSRYARKRDPVRSIVIGGVLLVAGMVGFAFAGPGWQFVAAMVIFTIGETFIIPAEFAVIDRIAPPDRRGSYFGAQTFAQLGGFIGPFTGGLILAHYGGTAMFLGVSVFAVISVLIYLLVGRNLPGLQMGKATPRARTAVGDGAT
ncbi:MFS transporter [Verrucosispora sp. WMMD703]|nr:MULTISPECIES: MFS transporter [Micromonospora]WFE47895.1 MFS transporter [Verrucosispora sp. WMMD1129]SFD41858.1 Predicted arabinose efflux permease, MFS family [Micromonospora sediminimaris]